MGKFTNTKYYDTQDSLVQLNKDLLQNPFYLFNDKKGTKVKYYNINTEKSTLDPGSKMAYTDLGSESPFRYNLVEDLYIYQFIKFELELESNEFGMENAPKEGESYILPNTIEPYEGDFFEVAYLDPDVTMLYKVTDVQRDTLENGNNVWKIKWILDRTDNREIKDLVVETYARADVVAGTNLKTIVLKKDLEVAKVLEQKSISLANYFIDLFFDNYTQTFIYKWYNEYNMYDPFALEFMIRNGILNGSDTYVYLQHQCRVPATFSIDYDKSVYRAFEIKDKQKLQRSHYQSQAEYIDDKVGIFKTRYEAYWKLTYDVIGSKETAGNTRPIIPILREDTVQAIVDGNLEANIPCYEKILVKYFNDMDLLTEDVENLDCIDLNDNVGTYYMLLFVIFCLDFYTKKLLS